MRNFVIAAALILLTTMTACKPIYYVPAAPNVPLLTHKGEINGSIGLESANPVAAADPILGAFYGGTTGFNVQTAYALTKNVGIMASANSFGTKVTTNGTLSSQKKFYLLEAGAGYFKPLDNGFVFEIYGLLDYGATLNFLPKTIEDFPNSDGKLKAGIIGIAVQPSIGFKSKYFEAALSSRLINNSFVNIKGSLTTSDPNLHPGWATQKDYLTQNRNNIMLEPALTLRAGLQNIKFQFQFGSSFNLSHADFPQEHLYYTVGGSFRF